jgi:hypothetical protein
MLTPLAEIVMATSTARPDRMGWAQTGTSYITPFGLAKDISLSRTVIERAAAQLKGVGLLDVLPDKDDRGFESWRINETVWPLGAVESDWS